MKNEEFQIRAYGRTELARRYMPRLSSGRAWATLKRWIACVPGLHDRLARLGYRKGQRTWTPAMVQEIVDAIGEP